MAALARRCALCLLSGLRVNRVRKLSTLQRPRYVLSATVSQTSSATKAEQNQNERKEETREESEAQKGGIPWFAIFLNVSVPSFIYWLVKRRLREPFEKEAEKRISIHRSEMEYLIRKTQFTAKQLHWLKKYARERFSGGVAHADDWGEFLLFILNEIELHKRNKEGFDSNEDKSKPDKNEKKMDSWDALVLYRESPQLLPTGISSSSQKNGGGGGGGMVVDVEELLSGLSVLAIDKIIDDEELEKKKNKNESDGFKPRMKPDPWAKFDLAWSLVDADGDGKLTKKEFAIFCDRLIRFGYLKSDCLVQQTTVLPQFPPKFEILNGTKMADMYWEAVHFEKAQNSSTKKYDGDDVEFTGRTISYSITKLMH